MSTLRSTFVLKEPQGKGKISNNETLILFRCNFKNEGKRFIYSTGERIAPKSWDFKNRQPLLHGSNRSKVASSIRMQINRYKDKFEELQAICKSMDRDFTSKVLKDEFDKEFKRLKNAGNSFFEAYDEFMNFKKKIGDWSPSTVKRYDNIKNILQDFERDRKFPLSFNSIDNKFHAEFTDYSINQKNQINNTFSRNVGLFKTFMGWALDNGYTYKDDFKKFKKMKVVITNQIALDLKDLDKLMKHDFKKSSLERIRDVFVFACVTGMRFGELKLISLENIVDGQIHLKEEKNSEKEVRRIPLNDLALFILRKYNFDLPLIANQKHNEYIKDVFEAVGYTHDVEKVVTKGKESIREIMPFYKRISSHTARRTFITMMKKKGFSDKLIASISGHSDMKTLNQYYQVDDAARSEAVKDVFKVSFEPLKKVD